MKKINFIKALVFIMTFALFFGLFVMIGLLTDTKDKSKVMLAENISINQPIGSNIKNVLTNDNYLYIVVSGGNLADRIVIFDTNDGSIISNISLN